MAHQGEDVDVDPMAPADMVVDPNPYVRCIVISDSGRIEEGKEWERAWLCQDDVMYDQGTEPFCWALSTAQVMAYRHSIIWCAPIIHYSAQELMNSVRPFAEEAYTLILERAFEFILYNKISELTDVPFLGKKDVCAARAPAQSDRALGIVGYYSADFPSEDVLIAFLSHGPVVVGIISSPEFELLVGVDKGNIYQGALEFEKYVFHNCFTTHAVVLVGDGYDPNKGQSYWLIKNSVGQNWGKKGFGKIVKDCSIPDRYRGKTIISACIPIFNHESERCSWYQSLETNVQLDSPPAASMSCCYRKVVIDLLSTTQFHVGTIWNYHSLILVKEQSGTTIPFTHQSHQYSSSAHPRKLSTLGLSVRTLPTSKIRVYSEYSSMSVILISHPCCLL